MLRHTVKRCEKIQCKFLKIIISLVFRYANFIPCQINLFKLPLKKALKYWKIFTIDEEQIQRAKSNDFLQVITKNGTKFRPNNSEPN